MTIGAAVIVAVTMLGYASDAVDAWPKVGWKTPTGHAKDIAELRAESVGAVTEFRDEWKCDEYDEELRDLLREQQNRRDVGLSENTDLNEDIRRLREKIDKLNCARFEG